MNPNNKKEYLKKIFEDTYAMCQKSPLKDSIENTIDCTIIYNNPKWLFAKMMEGNRKYDSTRISITKFRSLESAMYFKRKNPDSKVGLLNFASATNPGGGVRNGSTAQEEALCRCTTLFPCLETEFLKKKYYDFHRDRHDTRYTSAVIYTPNIIAFKTDDFLPSLLPPKKWEVVDVLSCAAPNLREHPNNAMNPGNDRKIHVSDSELLAIHEERAKNILSVACLNDIAILVLGAFGCGAFQNDPEIVAEAYKNIIPAFDGKFIEISFAIYSTPKDKRNFDAFSKVLKNLVK